MITEPEIYSARIKRARSLLARQGLDALMISSLPNIRYLTGFSADSAYLLLTPSDIVVFTDPRFALDAVYAPSCRLLVEKGPIIKAVVSELIRKKCRAFGFEKEHLSYGAFLELKSMLPPRFRPIPCSGLVESLRTIKSPHEIELISCAAEINAKALEQTVPALRPGVTEVEIAAELEYQMRKLGASGPAFPSIVAFGKNSAHPHARPSQARLQNRTLVLIDSGASFQGYASDMTRMFHVGPVSPELKALHEAVLTVQEAAIEALRPGIPAARIDRLIRSLLENKGLARYITHSSGHGLGLEVHERPCLASRERACLREGMALTIEPGVYLLELGGIRIEDTLVVTATGCQILTRSPKELTVL